MGFNAPKLDADTLETLATVDDIQGDRIVSLDGLKDLIISDTDLKYQNGNRDIIRANATSIALFSPDGSLDFDINDSNLTIERNGNQRLQISSIKSKLTANDNGNYFEARSASVRINQGGQRRMWFDNVSSDLRGPNQSEQISVTNSGAFYNGSEILTVSDKGVFNGLATLGATGFVPTSQLPSFVDDVVEFATLAALVLADPQDSGKIYVTIDDNKTYRFSGTPGSYVEISASLALGITAGTAFFGDKGQTAYEHSQTPHDFATLVHSHDEIVSSDTLKNLIITDTDLIYNDGNWNRINVSPVVLALVSADGSNSIILDDFGTRISNQGIDNIEVSDGAVTLRSTNTLETITVDNSGAFYNTKQLLTVSSGVQQPISRSSTTNGVAKFSGTDGDRIKSSSKVKITDADILEFDNSRRITVNITTGQNEDNMVGPLAADLWVVVPAAVTKFTVRDLNNNIGAFIVRIIFIDGTDELTLTRGHDFVEVYKISGEWHYYNFRTGIGGKITT